MTKILITSDWHIDWSTTGMLRFDDVARAVEDTVEAARDLGVSLYLFLGDLSDPYGARAWRAVDFACHIASDLVSEGIPSVWISGNHDVLDDGHGTTVLGPISHVGESGFVTVMTEPRVLTVAGLELLLLPHPGKGRAYDPAEFVRRIGEPAEGKPCKLDLVAAHLTLAGYDRGSEADDMPRGKEALFPYDECRQLFPGATLLCGHHHRRGRHGDAEQSVYVPGSLERLTFNEEHNKPGYLVLEI